MNPHVAQARTNYEYYLETGLSEAVAGQPGDGKAYWIVGYSYRILALCALLEDADSARFGALLSKSAQSQLELYRAPRQGVESQYFAISKNPSFLNALAAGDLETARWLVELAPEHQADTEYEEDYLYYAALQRILLEDDEGYAPIAARWDEVVEGAASSKRQLCQALVDRDSAAFAEALGELIEQFRDAMEAWKQKIDYREELGAVESQVFTNGLGLLRLAEQRGLTTESEYDFLPASARVPVGAPPFDEWRVC